MPSSSLFRQAKKRCHLAGFPLALLLALGLLSGPLRAQIPYPGRDPGAATLARSKDVYTLSNRALSLSYRLQQGRLRPLSFANRSDSQTLRWSAQPWFELQLSAGQLLRSQDFRLLGTPRIETLCAVPQSLPSSHRLAGKALSVWMRDPSGNCRLHLLSCLRDGSNYVEQHWTLYARDSLPLRKAMLLMLSGDSLRQAGTVDGSPLVEGTLFFALEHPMSRNRLQGREARAFLSLQQPLSAARPLEFSSVLGVVPQGQLRRGFLYYLERQRAHPYRPFLHYNSWYDLSWVDRKLDNDSCLDRIRMYGDSLVRARHVPMQAFLFDDGWDNDSTLWEVSRRFPQGFRKEQQLAARYGAHIGVWISPWGGYDPSKALRIHYGRMQHPAFETNAHGFSLAGPVYFRRFLKVTSRFIREYGVSIFKFDGVGAGNGASGAGVAYQPDIDALLRLCRDLRALKPDIYLSLTVGTWPSPYWLWYGDAVWRAGADFGRSGSGSPRQQWITYRDAQSYKNVVKRAPLFPLNSVMLHGINLSELGYPKALERDPLSIEDEIWDFFASGTSLQELYINPHLLNYREWNCLAAAELWSEAHKDILSDVHWIGGDPDSGSVYGYAAWAPRGGVFSLRNPTAQPKTIRLRLDRIFDLPPGAATRYYLEDARHPEPLPQRVVSASEVLHFTLSAYELKVFSAPARKQGP